LPSIALRELLLPLLSAGVAVVCFGASARSLRLAVLVAGAAVLPIPLNLAVLLALAAVSLLLGPPLAAACDKHGRFGIAISGVAHGWAVLTLLVAQLLVALVSLSATSSTTTTTRTNTGSGDGTGIGRLFLGTLALAHTQRALLRVLTVLAIPREPPARAAAATNAAWWGGRWCAALRAARVPPLAAVAAPARELLCKTVEMACFAADFAAAHAVVCLLLPICFIPYVDRAHTLLLLWALPKRAAHAPSNTTTDVPSDGPRPTAIATSIPVQEEQPVPSTLPSISSPSAATPTAGPAATSAVLDPPSSPATATSAATSAASASTAAPQPPVVPPSAFLRPPPSPAQQRRRRRSMCAAAALLLTAAPAFLAVLFGPLAVPGLDRAVAPVLRKVPVP
ncbi:1,3-beta-D-glucan synthase, partial [Cladochytrium tenue]